MDEYLWDDYDIQLDKKYDLLDRLAQTDNPIDRKVIKDHLQAVKRRLNELEFLMFRQERD